MNAGTGPGRQLVVAAVITSDTAVLAARRSYPPALAGKWEFPGGKAEPGEGPEQALVRELAEELAVEVELGTEITAPAGGPWPIDERLELRLWWARLASDDTPRPLGSHDRLSWVEPDDLPSLDWLPADQPMISRIRQLWQGRR